MRQETEQEHFAGVVVQGANEAEIVAQMLNTTTGLPLATRT